jgi:hypothetical protein
VRNIRGLKAQNKEILEALDTIQGMLATKHSALGLLEDDPFKQTRMKRRMKIIPSNLNY